MAEVKLDGRIIGPLEAVRAEMGTAEFRGGWRLVLIGDTEHEQ